jgi:hypothetical protein
MADTITLIPHDDEAQRILDAFEQRTGLEAEDASDGARVYPIEGDEHQIDVVQTLTDIDEDWTDHIAVGDPA